MKKLATVLVLVIAILITGNAQSYHADHNPLMEHGPLLIQKPSTHSKMKQYTERSGITIPAPTISFVGNQALRIQRSIHNPTDSALSFYFSHLFKNDQEFVDYLRAFVTNPTDTPQAQRELMSALFDVTKYYFSNNTLIFDWQNDTAVFKKEMSFIGFLYSMHNVQCGNFFRHAITILIATQYFTLADFETIAVPGHSIGQIKNMNKPIFSDFDAGTGFSWNKNSNSPNGYADIDEIRQDTFLINEYYSRNGVVLVDTTNPYHLRSNYRRLLTGNPLYRGPLYGYAPPVHMTSELILPAHSDVVTHIDNIILAFDVNDSSSINRVNNVIAALQPIYQAGGCTWCIDSFLTVLSQEFRIDKQLLNTQALAFTTFNSSTDQGKPFGDVFSYEYERETPPIWNLSGANQDTLVLGVDLQMPFLLLHAQGINGLARVGDTLFISPATFHLWDAGDTSPRVTSPEVNYIQHGFIPPSQGWNMTLAVNAHLGMLSLMEEWGVDMINGTGLTFETEVDYLSTQVTAVTDINKSKSRIGIYPNPAHTSLWVTGADDGVLIPLYNLLGEPVLQLHKGTNNVTQVSPGIYIAAQNKIVIF